MHIKALSIVSPSGSKIANGEKTIEVRSWTPTDFPADADLLIVENEEFLREEADTDPNGRAVAVVKIARTRRFVSEDVPAACAKYWADGYFSWELKDVRRCDYPVRVPAKRGIYDVELDTSKLTIASAPNTELRIRELSPNSESDLSLLQEVLEGAPAYWVKISGRTPGQDAAEETFKALPEGKTYSDKYVLGIEFQDGLVGCIDVIRGFPRSDTAMLGLLLLRESRQKQGLGKKAYQSVEAFIRNWPEIKIVRIGVVGANDGVLPFWRGAGFKETGVRRPYENGPVMSETIVLEKYF